jgi:crotonobetainyl-CoA:carnitine CoA-transferase CaiB-like acyl-CoA transferase
MLSPYKVLDLTGGHGDFASMVLGDMGAAVIKVEPPGGSGGRRTPPFIKSAPGPERSLHFFCFNRNKQGITLDLSGAAGRRALSALVEQADFLFESAQPAALDSLGMGFDVLKTVNPRLVHVAISPWGWDGPYSGMAASDLTIAAMGGPMSLQGHPGRAPVRLSVPQVWLHAGAEAATAALIAHALMINTGEGQFVDVSGQAAMTATMLQGIGAYDVQGYDYNRGGSDLQLGGATVPIVFECADGYVVLIPSGPTLFGMVPWFVAEGVVPTEWLENEDWPTYHFRLLQQQPIAYSLDEVLDAIRRYVARYPKQELLDRGLRDGVTIAPVSDMEDLARFRHLDERGYWLEAPLPDGRTVKAPGFVAKMSRTPMTVRGWAPRLGEHNQEVLGGLLGLSQSEIAMATGA